MPCVFSGLRTEVPLIDPELCQTPNVVRSLTGTAEVLTAPGGAFVEPVLENVRPRGQEVRPLNGDGKLESASLLVR